MNTVAIVVALPMMIHAAWPLRKRSVSASTSQRDGEPEE